MSSLWEGFRALFRRVGTQTETRSRGLVADLNELNRSTRAGAPSLNLADTFVLPLSENPVVFPRIKTTSLRTKRIVLQDEATRAPATLVILLFREFAHKQAVSWQQQDIIAVPWLEMTINESVVHQALSGFAQGIQRRRIPEQMHDRYIAYNSGAEKLETFFLSQNRLLAHALLLDRRARVRWRACGFATDDHVSLLSKAVAQLTSEDQNLAKSPSDHFPS
uniref:Uncharacterized protein n=1 Tax=Compsopogon caeruleus TaxID=31354 RepID=A0A7S1TAV0_9RHOD|mmetsp:Transcript_14830/g.30179  ORF Transcript_14830/g.30179 Transcript_14830/m.30179 type:complete len:221 (+) Transcript_14830:149-811(+)|eukprot:CAMPEP_0184688108 /NCGR_PEP_ID=MMETSP0312-20130426/28574_1 /TAXON_ID=31354 /ORGANISM="Compsopogon coeruleus, Strain SAG 36.94" /LENGTH=220 /DNA_ID=CAMNT_0027144889 /DNA_START=132 /DNA_END=794 /DNA_ORIENTATION=-